MEKIKRMPTPTFVVGWKDFNDIAYKQVPNYIIHGKKGLKVVPEIAQEIGENVVIFPNGPKEIIFRRRFTKTTCTRKVRHITADNSDRYDLRFTIIFK